MPRTIGTDERRDASPAAREHDGSQEPGLCLRDVNIADVERWLREALARGGVCRARSGARGADQNPWALGERPRAYAAWPPVHRHSCGARPPGRGRSSGPRRAIGYQLLVERVRIAEFFRDDLDWLDGARSGSSAARRLRFKREQFPDAKRTLGMTVTFGGPFHLLRARVRPGLGSNRRPTPWS